MAHTFDTSYRLAKTAANPATFSYTCGAGTTLLVLFVFAAPPDRGGGAPTYNGIALSQADQRRYASSSPEIDCECWYLINPPTGSAYTVSIPNPNARNIMAVAASFKAAAGYTSALRVATGGSNTSTNPSCPPLTGVQSGDALVAGVGNGADAWAPTARTGVQLYDQNDGTYGHGTQYLLPTSAGDVTMSWTFDTSDDWGAVAAAFMEVQAPRTGTVGAVLASVGAQTSGKVRVAGIVGSLGWLEEGWFDEGGWFGGTAVLPAIVASLSEAVHDIQGQATAVLAPAAAALSGKAAVVGGADASLTTLPCQAEGRTRVSGGFEVQLAAASAQMEGEVSGSAILQPTGIESEDFGQASVRLFLRPAAIEGLDAPVGTPHLLTPLWPVGIPGAEAIGPVRLSLKVKPRGIISKEAHGFPRIHSAVAVLRPGGIRSREYLSVPEAVLVVRPAGIPTGAGFGSATLTYRLQPAGILEPGGWFVDGFFEQPGWFESVPRPRLVRLVGVAAIDSGEAWGSAAVQLGQSRIHPVWPASGEAFGIPRAAPQMAGLQPLPITAEEEIGSPRLRCWNTLRPAGVSSAAVAASPTLRCHRVTVKARSVPAAEGLGLPCVGVLKTLVFDLHLATAARSPYHPFWAPDRQRLRAYVAS